MSKTPHRHVQWVIKLLDTQKEPYAPPLVLPKIAFYVPNPMEEEGGWIRLDEEIEQEAMESIDEIQKECQDVQEQTKERMFSEGDEEEKGKERYDNLHILDQVLDNLYSVLKKFHRTRDVPPEDL